MTPAETEHPEWRRLVRWATATAILLIALALLAAVADTARSRGGVFAACVSEDSGEMRLVDPGSGCRSGEFLLEWDDDDPATTVVVKQRIERSKGLTGATGATGVAGLPREASGVRVRRGSTARTASTVSTAWMAWTA